MLHMQVKYVSNLISIYLISIILFMLFQNQIRNQKEILSDLLGAQSIKTITLKVLHEGILQLQQALSIQQKNNVNVYTS